MTLAYFKFGRRRAKQLHLSHAKIESHSVVSWD